MVLQTLIRSLLETSLRKIMPSKLKKGFKKKKRRQTPLSHHKDQITVVREARKSQTREDTMAEVEA